MKRVLSLDTGFMGHIIELWLLLFALVKKKLKFFRQEWVEKNTVLKSVFINIMVVKVVLLIKLLKKTLLGLRKARGHGIIYLEGINGMAGKERKHLIQRNMTGLRKCSVNLGNVSIVELLKLKNTTGLISRGCTLENYQIGNVFA